MFRPSRPTRALVSGLVALFVLGTLPLVAMAASYAATASIAPTAVAQGVATTFTVTVNNTGTSTTIGAVEVRRPGSKWLFTSCLSAPAGWSVMTASDTMCRFKSSSGTADDIQPNGGQGQFTFSATPASTGTTYSGTFKVTVSNMNSFAKPARLIAAGGPLGVTANGDAAPSVSATGPVDGATQIQLNTNVNVGFSESVSVSASSFTLECPTGTPVSFTIGPASPNSGFTLNPNSDLPTATTCTATVIANQVSDADAVDPPDNMASNYVFSFTTDSPPAVTSTTPTDGATDVDPTANMTVTFSENVSVGSTSFTLECDSFTQTFQVSGSGTSTITVDPDADLPEGASCTLTAVAANISDSDFGDPPDHPTADWTVDFTTGDAPPHVTLTGPTDGSIGIPLDSNVSVSFSESVSASTSSFTLECPTGTPISYTLSSSPASSFTLDPTSDLPASTVCSVKVVANQVSDTDANDPPDNMAADYNFSFTTAPPNTAPALDNSKDPTVAAEDEDAPTPTGAVGTKVSDLVDFTTPSGGLDNVSDPDAGAVTGIAVTSEQTFIPVGGTWYYSTDASTWTAFPVVSNSNSLLLAADSNTRVYFKPSLNFNGTISNGLTFRAWDRTSGTNGGTADTTTNGGTTAFSTDTDTASITINAVNDAPAANTDSAQTVPNVELFFDVATGGVPGTTKTTVSGNGVLDNDSDAEGNNLSVTAIVGCVDVTAPFDCATTNGGSISMDAAGHFTYVPVAGSSTADSFQYTVTDDGAPPASTNVTVNLTFVGNRIWFVKNNATAGGTGRSNDPFDTLAEAQTAANAANDVVFVYYGDGTNTGQSAGFTMQAAGQRLQGEAVALTTGTTVNGVSNATLVAAGSRPLVDNGFGQGVDMSVGSTVTGLSLRAGLNAIQFYTTGNATGDYLIENNVIRGAGSRGIVVELDTGATGTANVKVVNNTFSLVLPILGAAMHAIARSGTLTISYQANTIINDATFGIVVQAGGTGTINATIITNTLNLTSAGDSNAILLESAQISSDTSSLCAKIGGPTLAEQNTLSSAGSSDEIKLRQTGATSIFRLPGYGGSGTDDTAVQNFVLSQNASNGATALASHVSSAGFGAGSPCPTPTP